MQRAKWLPTALPKLGINWALISLATVKALRDGLQVGRVMPSCQMYFTDNRCTNNHTSHLSNTLLPVAFFRASLILTLLIDTAL